MHVDDDLSAYLDGELAPAERARVDAHVDGCERCRARLGELRATASLIAALPSARPARPLVPRVVERYNWLRPLRSFSAFATGAFLMVFLVTAVGRSGSGLGGGPEVPFGRTPTTGGAPAAAPAATAAAQRGSSPNVGAAPTPTGPFVIPAPAVDAARSAASPSPATGFAVQQSPKATDATVAAPRAESAGSPQAELASREQRREPPPFTDPVMWLGFAILAAAIAIYAHWRLRTT